MPSNDVRIELVDKVCTGCKIARPRSEFNRNKACKDGLNTRCKVCVAAYKEANKERLRQYHRDRYKAEKATRITRERTRRLALAGTTPEEYEQVHTLQRGLCAICHEPESDVDKRNGQTRLLAADHDHDTGEFRGLLCRKCNTGLGLLRDDPTILENAIRYLERSYE